MTEIKDKLSAEERAIQVFETARHYPMSAPPYLKTRVLAELESRRARAGKLRFWRGLALSSSVLSAIAIFVFILVPVAGFQAKTNTPFVVRVDLEELKTHQIARAEIELPSGVFFYSQKFPEVSDQRTLALAWNDEINVTQLPFVIRSKESGSKRVTIRFFNGDGHVVATKELSIHFKT